MTFDEWLNEGVRNGWTSDSVCYFHDVLPVTEEEDEEIGEGGDPCIHILRLYPDPLTRQLAKEHMS